MSGADLLLFGHPLRLEVAEATAEWIRQRWLVPCGRRGARPIHIGQGAVAWDEGAASFGFNSFDRTVSVQLGGGGFTLRLEGARLRAELDETRALLVLDGDVQLAPTLLWAALSELVRLGGLLPFHAAGLAREGRCAVLMGPSGTGKSTTLVKAALAGYQPLAEDMLWIDPASLQVYGNDREIRLWGDSLERFGALLPAAVQRPYDGKFAVPLDALPGYPAGDCRLRRLVVLRRDLSAPSAWEAVAELELVRALWESSWVPMTPAARELAQAGIATLLRTVPHAGLRIGSTGLDFEPLLS